jgi:hypothetical protein
MELDKRGAELLFRVLTERRKSKRGDRFQRVVQRLDQDLHRPAAIFSASQVPAGLGHDFPRGGCSGSEPGLCPHGVMAVQCKDEDGWPPGSAGGPCPPPPQVVVGVGAGVFAPAAAPHAAHMTAAASTTAGSSRRAIPMGRRARIAYPSARTCPRPVNLAVRPCARLSILPAGQGRRFFSAPASPGGTDGRRSSAVLLLRHAHHPTGATGACHWHGESVPDCLAVALPEDLRLPVQKPKSLKPRERFAPFAPFIPGGKQPEHLPAPDSRSWKRLWCTPE